MRESYLNAIALIERLHRELLEVVHTELDGLGALDITNVQAMILFNIGSTEMAMGELTLRGCYMGSNVSYNVKKMVEHGYLVEQRSTHDRRSIRVRLSPSGLDLCAKLDAMHRQHIEQLRDTPIDKKVLDETCSTLKRLDRFWTRIVDNHARRLAPA